MPVRASAPSTLWPDATPPYAVPQNAAWNARIAGLGERGAHRVHAHVGVRAVLEPAERMDADAGDLDAVAVTARTPTSRPPSSSARRRRASSAVRTSSRAGSASASRVIDPQRSSVQLDDAEAVRHRRPRSRAARAVTAVQRPQRAVARQRDAFDVGARRSTGTCRAAGSGTRRSTASSRRRGRCVPSSCSSNRPSCIGARRSSHDALASRASSSSASDDAERAEHLVACARRAGARRPAASASARRRRAGTAPADAPGRSTGSSTVTRSPRARQCGSAKMSAAVYAVATGTSLRDAARLRSRSRRAWRSTSATMPLISSLCAARSASFAKRGSSTRSGRSIASHSRAKFASEPATMHTYLPSRGRVVVERRASWRGGCPRGCARRRAGRRRRASTRGCAARRRRARRRSRRRCPPRASRAYSAHDGRLRREDAGEVVGDRDADAHRRPVGIAGEVQQTAVADADPVEARAAAAFGPSWPNIEMRTVTRRGSQVAGRDVPLLERAGPEVLDDDVGRRREPAVQRPGRRACAGRA